MYVCYLDEAGCTGRLRAANDTVQPVLVVGALIFHTDDLRQLTLEFLRLKSRYFPPSQPATGRLLDRILVEIKGADLRRDYRSTSRSPRRRMVGFVDDLLDLLTAKRAKLVGRVWVKPIGGSFNGTSIYTSSVQSICGYYQQFLTGCGERGVVIADGRSKAKNINVAHSVFTQKFQAAGDAFNRMLEMPTFGNSDNHAGLQMADLICSALLFPIAAFSYCYGHVANQHVHQEYSGLKRRYGPRLEGMQFRFPDMHGRVRGGVVVSDAIGARSSALMFR